MRVLMLGDSHLARLEEGDLERMRSRLGAEVENAAAGGAWSGDLHRQVGARDLTRYDAVVLSIGTNDAHPSTSSSPRALRANVAELLTAAPPATLLRSPGMRRAPVPFDTEAVNVAISSCMDAAADAVRSHGGRLLPTLPILARLGDAAWAADGMHLSRPANALVIAALVAALLPPGVRVPLA